MPEAGSKLSMTHCTLSLDRPHAGVNQQSSNQSAIPSILSKHERGLINWVDKSHYYSMKTAMKKSNKVLGYVRVSTGKQDLSMEAQEEKIRLYCQLNSLDLVEVIRERAVTAKIKLNKRPEGSRIEKMLSKGTHHIVSVKLDRLFRNAVDALSHVEEWDAAGISLHLVDLGGMAVNTGSSMGKMLITMLAGWAEFERNIISERTATALSFKKRSGLVYNHVPFGFKAEEGTLRPDATEQTVIARMATLRGQGVSYNEIANALNADGVPTKHGNVWRSQTVKNTLTIAAS